MAGLPIQRCSRCATAVFPSRIWCPVCGGRAWAPETATGGLVAETTVVRHAVGATPDAAPVRLATIALDAGPVVVAGLDDDVGAGDRIVIDQCHGAPRARGASRG